ncbi:MAG: diphthine--ammonia ligase [Nitrososphaeria archaeon]
MWIMKAERSYAAALLSGGKDSNYAILKYYKMYGMRPCCGITVNARKDDMLFHSENVRWVGLQCESMGIPWIFVEDLEEGLRRAREEYGAELLITGGILSNFQRKRFEELASKHNMKTLNPLWGVDQQEYMLNLIRDGVEYIIVKVASLGLGREWLGIKMDLERTIRLIELSRRYRFNPSLEGGEGETFVLHTPLYSRRIIIRNYEVIWEKDSGTYLIKDAALE